RTRGTGPTRARLPPSPPRGRARTRSGPRSAAWTERMGTGTWSVSALRWKRMHWRLTKEATGRSGAENMAIDASLLAESDATGRAFLRLYRFDPPCLSLGRNEPADQYDRATIARLRLDVARLPTGGRAVWHQHEVTYAVAAPVAAFGSLRSAYRAIHERLVVALRSPGADATLAPDRAPPSPRGLDPP